MFTKDAFDDIYFSINTRNIFGEKIKLFNIFEYWVFWVFIVVLNNVMTFMLEKKVEKILIAFIKHDTVDKTLRILGRLR